jgi:hypothetical protein
VYRFLVVIPEGNKPLGRRSRIREDNIRVDLEEIEQDGVDWIHLDQDTDKCRTFVNTVLHNVLIS